VVQKVGWDWRLRLKADLLVFQDGGESADSGDGGQAFHLKADSESGRSRTAFR
jgi:hypothetical protein